MHIEDDVEAISHYTPGGYALIEPEMVLGRRYEVVDKLGHGDSATVWLCWNRATKPPKMQWVAIKVFNAARSTSQEPLHEMQKEELLRRGGKKAEWTAARVGMPLGEFRHDDVMLGHAGAGALSRIPDALAYLHRHGVAHGQVARQNIRWKLDFQDTNICSTSEMKYRLGLERRKGRTNATRPNQPGFLIPSADLEKLAPKGRIVLVPSSTGATDPGGVPHWYWGPEVLTGLGFLTGIEYRDRPGGDVWSFCCLVLDLYARCTLGVADAGASDANLWQHIKTLERFLGPFCRPVVFLKDERGQFIDRIPSEGRMCESEADYERWNRSALGNPLPQGTTALEALLGSARFRRSWAPLPVEPDAVLSRTEAGDLAAKLKSALCYEEGERSMKVVQQSKWFSDTRLRSENHPMFGKLIPGLAESCTLEPGKTSEDSGERDAKESAPDAAEPAAADPKIIRPHITETHNPLLQLATLDVARTDVLELLDITRDVVVPEDEILVQTPPARKIKEAKRILQDARKNGAFSEEGSEDQLEEYGLNVCRAYRDHGERVLTRARALTTRANESEACNDHAGAARYIGKVARLMKEYTTCRAERVTFYRKELRLLKTSDRLHQDMLGEFPDLQDGELDPGDPPSREQAEGINGVEEDAGFGGPSQDPKIVTKSHQDSLVDESRDVEGTVGTLESAADIRPTEEPIAKDAGNGPPGEQQANETRRAQSGQEVFPLEKRHSLSISIPSPRTQKKSSPFDDGHHRIFRIPEERAGPPDISEFFGLFMDPDPDELAELARSPTVPIWELRRGCQGDSPSSTESGLGEEDLDYSPLRDAVTPLLPEASVDTVDPPPGEEPISVNDPVPVIVVTEELPSEPGEVQIDSDTPGQELLGVNADVDEFGQAASSLRDSYICIQEQFAKRFESRYEDCLERTEWRKGSQVGIRRRQGLPVECRKIRGTAPAEA
ncbi:kinase-like protein [Apiospora sp. TS-2023a]